MTNVALFRDTKIRKRQDASLLQNSKESAQKRSHIEWLPLTIYIPFSSQFDSCTVDNSPPIYNPNRKGTAQKWEGKNEDP